MRVHCVVLLLVAAAFLAGATATSASTQAKINFATLDQSHTAAQFDISAQRFLRVHYTERAEDENEERGFTTAVEKTKALLGSSTFSEKTLARWVKNNKSPKNALIRLKLDKAGDKLFENSQFETWATYMTMLNKQDPDAAMISALSTRYSDDVLSQMLIAAEKVSGSNELATKLQAGQRRVWQSNWKSADDVFKLLKLNNAGGRLFGDPQFIAWTKYVDDLNQSNPKKANSVIVSTLTIHYGDEKLAALIRAAKDVEETKTMATDLQKAQVNNWFVVKERPDKVKIWLGLKETTSRSAEANLYQTYVKNYEKVITEKLA
ncbi:putative secreted RxLR effector protein [Phytophthora cinnamomi]|uniref:putative secreted RxLR effector protein n=1 Tax=Phytophthora cinnamomi TaxID=4785 RepID=UPI002A337E42|nr:putative secreted RxLR effector protein [Phytophthora cinnamomi]KAJ8523839.1 hypothetical protein ON010_g17279 [Phytophthora cinnamomi]QVE55550.1 RxLR effector protein 42 [Phytophthora cinnamomi]